MATILKRSEWTSTPNRRAGRTLLPSEVTAIALHYPGTGNIRHEGESKDYTAKRLRVWRDLHIRAPRSWADIGYNYAVDQAGRIWYLTGLNRGAHAGTAEANRESVGVLLIVGDKEQPTQAMIDAVRSLRAEILKELPKATEVRPHSSYTATGCPGDPVRKLIADGVFTGKSAAQPKPDPEDDEWVRWFESRFLNLWGDSDEGARSFDKRAPSMVADLTKGSPEVVSVCELRDDQARKTFTPLMVDAGYFAAHVDAGNGLYLAKGSQVGYRGTYYLPKKVQGEGRREALLRCRAKVAGHWVHLGVTHLDYRNGPEFDLLRVRQAESVIAAMTRFGARYELPQKHRHLIAMDSNSNSWVRDRAFEPHGYYAVVKEWVDEQYVGKGRPALATKTIYTESDHRIQAVTLAKARPKG